MSEDHPLNTTLSKVSPKKMAEARESVRTEVEVSVTHRPSKPSDPGEDSQADFVVDLNNVADMLILLVGKYQRAYRLTLVCVILILACVGLLVKAGFEMDYLQKSQLSLMEELRKTKDEVKKTGDKVDKTKDEVKETKEKVEEAAEAAPKVEVDQKTGKARVILPRVKDEEPAPKASASASASSAAAPKPPPTPKHTGSKKPPPAPPAPKQTSAPLNPEIGF